MDNMKEAVLLTDFCRKVQDYCARMDSGKTWLTWDETSPEDKLLAVQAVAIYLPALIAKMCEDSSCT